MPPQTKYENDHLIELIILSCKSSNQGNCRLSKLPFFLQLLKRHVHTFTDTSKEQNIPPGEGKRDSIRPDQIMNVHITSVAWQQLTVTVTTTTMVHNCSSIRPFFLLSCWSTRDYIGRSTRNSNPVMTSSAGGAKDWPDHRFHAPPAYIAQLLTLHQHRANSQYRTANQI